jgi:alpha-1,2-mannosyltransferase
MASRLPGGRDCTENEERWMTRAVSAARTIPTREADPWPSLRADSHRSRVAAPATRTDSRRGRPLRTAAFLALGLAVLIHAVVVWELNGYFDIRVYHGAINSWVNGGDLYAYTESGTRYGYTYPPFAGLTMLPMSLVSFWAAAVVSLVSTVAASAMVFHWLVSPIARRRGWDRRLTLAAVGLLAVAFEPLSDTLGMGQVNMLLVGLVAADLVLLTGRGRRAGGVLIGLATAIKLTPAVFIVYLLVTRRWRAAAVAGATAAGTTLLAAVVAPRASWEFWTDALWHTERVGDTWVVNNQSLGGLVARLNPAHPSTLLWLALALIAAAVWAYRVRAAVAAGDEMTGFALTGAAACLLSPITWVHHLVWLLPGILVLVGHAYAPGVSARRRHLLLWSAAAAYGLLCSRVIFLFDTQFTGWGALGSNAFVILTALLLGGLPIRSAPRIELSTGQSGAAPGTPTGPHDAGRRTPVIAGHL